MSNGNGMSVPEWTDSLRDKMIQVHQEVRLDNSSVSVREKEVIETFSTHFAEHELKEGDLLVHLFPRRGSEDRWYPSEYRDGNYIPSRREAATALRFPDDMEDRIKKAVDAVWQGDVAIDKVIVLAIDPGDDVETAKPYEHETGAYVVQFQNAANTVEVVGQSKFMDSFCEAVDKHLE